MVKVRLVNFHIRLLGSLLGEVYSGKVCGPGYDVRHELLTEYIPVSLELSHSIFLIDDEKGVGVSPALLVEVIKFNFDVGVVVDQLHVLLLSVLHLTLSDYSGVSSGMG